MVPITRRNRTQKGGIMLLPISIIIGCLIYLFIFLYCLQVYNDKMDNIKIKDLIEDLKKEK